MKKNEISAKFNKHLAAAIAEGFAPSMTELRGSYSGVCGAQIVLAKGNERIIMWMEERHDYGDHNAPDTVSLFVARFALAKGETCEWNYMWPQDWKQHLIDEMTVYEVSARRDGWYVEDADEAARAKETHISRYDNRYRANAPRPVEVTDQLLAIVRRKRGFKTVKPENLAVIKVGKRWVFTNTLSRREVVVGA